MSLKSCLIVTLSLDIFCQISNMTILTVRAGSRRIHTSHSGLVVVNESDEDDVSQRVGNTDW